MDSHYKLVISDEVDLLEKKVNHLIAEGYIPIGTIVIQGCRLIQPMTLNVNPEINVNANVQNHY
jgi:hypothetical protein